MRINLLGSFAAGILLSTAICGVVYFSDKGTAAKATPKPAVVKTQTPVSEADMRNKLTAAGYVVQSKADYDKSINDAKAAAAKAAAPAAPVSNNAGYKVIVNVQSGMTSIQVGRMLLKAKLVNDAFAFSKDIEGKGLENHLKPGIYEVDTGMTYDQIVSTIFK